MILNKLSENNIDNLTNEYINNINKINNEEFDEIQKTFYLKIISEINFIKIYLNFFKNIAFIYNKVQNHNISYFISIVETKFKYDYMQIDITDNKYIFLKEIIGETKRINNLIFIKELVELNILKNDIINICTDNILNQQLYISDIYYWFININFKLTNNEIIKIKSILNYNFTSDLETKLDKIVNENAGWDTVVGDFYKDFSPLVEKLNIKVNTNDKKRFLGVDENNKNVYAYVGKYGPVVQIDEGKSAKYIKMGDDYTWDKIVLSEVALMNKFPKNIGKHNGKDILVKKGPYGIYLSDGTKNFKLSEGLDENLSLEDAVKCISGQSSEQHVNKTIDKYIIKSGKYGPYIDFEKKFYKIPKNIDLENITKEICAEIINKSLNIKKEK